MRHVGPVDLRLAPGMCVCLTGASGSGKTLLLRAIADLEPHGGRVLLDGRPCSAFKPAAWRRQVGMLPAESAWWHDRVGPHFIDLKRAWFTRLGLEPAILEREVARCSTGERQRLALLRLLQNRPRVLLLDEPTAALDPDSVRRVEDLIAEYRDGQVPVLWVTHDPEQIARVAHRVLQVADGRVGPAPP